MLDPVCGASESPSGEKLYIYLHLQTNNNNNNKNTNNKTKVMQCGVSRFQSEDSGKHPCGVCRKGFASNSILCVECFRCSGIKGK